MGWSNDQFTGTLVIPTGATSGARIELNGTTGRIEVYDATDALVYVIDGAIPGATAGIAGTPQVTVSADATTARISFPTGAAAANTSANLLAAIFNQGLANENVSYQMIGPSMDAPADDRIELLISSQNADDSSEANLIIRLNGGSSGNLLTLDKTNGFDLNRHVRIDPTSTTATALTINGPSGTTGDLLSLQVNAAAKAVMDENGVFTEYADNAFTTFTPTVTGGGSVTWTTQTGWYQRIGKRIFFTAYLQVNAAGSGATPINIDGPVSIYRGTRQRVGAHVESLTAGNNGSCQVVSFTGGSGATFDRLRNSTNGSITGADLLAGGLITITGEYREA